MLKLVVATGVLELWCRYFGVALAAGLGARRAKCFESLSDMVLKSSHSETVGDAAARMDTRPCDLPAISRGEDERAAAANIISRSVVQILMHWSLLQSISRDMPQKLYSYDTSGSSDSLSFISFGSLMCEGRPITTPLPRWLPLGVGNRIVPPYFPLKSIRDCQITS